MHQNIKINNVKSLDAKLYSGKYYDFMLYKGETSQYDISDLNSMVIADFSTLDIKDNILYSTATWKDAINNGVEMSDIGFTGIDNGFISFSKDRITNEDFLKILTKSKYKIEEGDVRLFLTPITGNTQEYKYPMTIEENEYEKFISLKGGFYQGFFKLHGHEYQVLPDKITNDLLLHFEVKPRSDYEVEKGTVNYIHPENKGIFFFIGTRAENKFWPYYKTDSDIMEEMKVNRKRPSDCEVSGCGEYNVVFLENDWLCPNGDGESYLQEEQYVGSGININTNIELYQDSAGHSFNEHGYNEFVTDNKFLLFNRTKTGFTVDNWVENTEATIVELNKHSNINYFPLFNRTKTGYTTDTIIEYTENFEYNYNIFKDVFNNAFCLKINDDGSIGYRYSILNCESENKYEVIEEYSKPNIIKTDEWNSINVRFAPFKTIDKCDNHNYKMKILIYVNGYLVFISKPINTFNFHELNDVYQKQEGVPYNISLGGGSIGLLETISLNYYDISEYILPIEKDYCGTFLGDIKSFKIYNGFIDYNSIQKFL